MIRRLPAIAGLLTVVLALWALPSPVRAQPAPWQSEKGYENGIPIGTKITNQNWQQYQQFMTEGMKAVFAGTNYWHMPKNLVIEVGPTRHIPPPKPYLEDTEKYGNQVSLAQTPDGGYAPKGYVAGFPFADPTKGDKAMEGQRIFWNGFYRPSPRVEGAPNCSYTLDSYGNFTRTADTTIVYSQLTHLSEPGFPRDVPDNGGYWFAKYAQQTAPEQGKYLTTLDLTPNDPTKVDELYEYVPSLRRSLRLSESARCAPLFGTDMTFDDGDEGPPGLPQLFKINYVGEKKVLALVHGAPASFDTCGAPAALDPRYYFFGSKSIIPFPSPGSGQWEVRDSYVVSMERLPQFARGYCYGKRVLYLDKENYFPTNTDIYDAAGKLYKWIVIFVYPAIIPGLGLDGQMLTITGPNTAYAVNFQDNHVTVFIGLHVCVDGDCKSQGFLDVSRYSSPEGLMKIAQ